jgi:hypothetical protein
MGTEPLMNVWEGNDSQESAVSPHVQEVIRSAEEELNKLLQQRAEIVRRIVAIKQLLPGLAELYGAAIPDSRLFNPTKREGVQRQRGLTQACRVILSESPTPLRARQGCEELQRKFPDLVKRHKDLKASVTTVFHRLVSYGEVRCFMDEEGLRVWQWIQEQRARESGNPLIETASETELHA